MTPREVAELAAEAGHDINMIYARALNDPAGVPWVDAPSWQKEAALAVVGAIMADPAISPERQHEIQRAYLATTGRPDPGPWAELSGHHQTRHILLGAAVRGVLTRYSYQEGSWLQTKT